MRTMLAPRRIAMQAGSGSGRPGRATAVAGCRRGASGRRRLALRRAHNAGAVLVAALVVEHLLARRLVGVRQAGRDLGDALVVVAGPRLVAAQRRDAVEHRRAVLGLAL